MKPQPLDLEVEHIYVNDLAEATINMIIQGLTTKEQIVDSKEEAITLIFDLVQEVVNEEIKQRIKSACEFYLRYKDKPELLIKEHPELKSELDKNYENYSMATMKAVFGIYADKVKIVKEEYNEWLFKLAFKGVMK